MKSLKNFLRKRFVQNIAAQLFLFYIKLVVLTSRIIRRNATKIYQLKAQENLIFAFWHGRTILLPSYLEQNGNYYSVVSQHSDGQLISDFLAKSGSKLIRGSSSKGGSKVIRNVITALKEPNTYIAIVPDGPRGPNMQVNGSVIDIARLANTKIVPISISVKKAKFFNSWDHFMLPKLFNHITMEYGEPLVVPKKASAEQIEKLRQKLETELNEITFRLDKGYGHPKIVTGKENTKR